MILRIYEYIHIPCSYTYEYTHNLYMNILGATLGAQMVKNLPVLWETQVQSLVWEDALEKGKATHSSILAWGIP